MVDIFVLLPPRTKPEKLSSTPSVTPLDGITTKRISAQHQVGSDAIEA